MILKTLFIFASRDLITNSKFNNTPRLKICQEEFYSSAITAPLLNSSILAVISALPGFNSSTFSK